MLIRTIGLLRPIATGTLQDAVGRIGAAWKRFSVSHAGRRTAANRIWLALKKGKSVPYPGSWTFALDSTTPPVPLLHS
jgi:hypothetical protein